MKIFKIISVIVVSILAATYFAFLFIVPNVVDINKFEPEIQKAVQESSGFKVNTENLTFSTGWNLSTGIKAERIDIFYPNNEKFSQIKNIEIKLSLLPLLMKQIKINSVNIENLILKLKVEKDGKFFIEKFIKATKSQSELPFGLKLSSNMPDINIDKYSISFIDILTNKIYSINGTDFKISDFILNKKIKIEGIGEVIFNKKKQLTYDLKIFSKVMPEIIAPIEKTPQSKPFNIIELFNALYKIDLNADLKVDLKLSGSMTDMKTDGNLDITNLTLKAKGQKLPKSFIKMKFSGNKIVINSNINTTKTEHILLNGVFKYGKNQFIDMNIKSDKILLSNLFNIISSFLPFFGINDIQGITANGTMKADFNIKSDFKKINSSGYLKIDNANIFYNLYNVAVKNINADVDFSKNQIGIKKSSALINGAPISLTGAIDTNAYANLSLKANKLPINGLLATFGMLPLLNENDIKSGIITLDATLKGKINKTKPQINVLIEKLNFYNKPSKVNISLNKASSVINLDKENKVKGKILASALSIFSNDFGKISSPSVNLIFDDKNFNIQESVMYYNNSKVNFKGKISNYASKKNSLNIEVFGLILANDIKNLIPKEFRKDIIAKGKLPIILRISGNLTEQDITAQLLANNTNYVSIIDIDSLLGKTSLVSLAMKMANNAIRISDISLNALSENKGLSEDFRANLRGSSPVVTIKGSIRNLQTQTPFLNNINLSIPSLVAFSIPSFQNSQIQMNGDINLNGSSKNPEIRGQLSFPFLYLPTIKLNSKNLNATLIKNSININCPNLVIADSQLGFSTILDNNFSKGLQIRTMDLNASSINLDTLALAMENFPQNSIGQGTDLGITLTNGKGQIQRFKTGDIIATNITSNFVINNNTLKMSNVRSSAYGGKVEGNIDYNLVFGNLKLNLQGRGLSAEPALRAFMGIKNLLSGNLDFDTENISLIAGTQAQMMQSLKGKTNFMISDGQMGTLGKLENLLYAQNILSNNILKTSAGAIAKAVSIKKTGDFKYIKGRLTFSNGWADIISIQTSGPAMSMYVTGKYNLLNNTAALITLGRLSDDVVQLLGPIGEFSVNKLIASIPKIGVITANLINQLTTSPSNENLSMLPNLTPKQIGPTKEFKVSIIGDIESKSSIRYFKWLSTPQAQPTTPDLIPSSIDEPLLDVEQTIKDETKNILQKVLPLPQNPSTPSTVPSSNNTPLDVKQTVKDASKNVLQKVLPLPQNPSTPSLPSNIPQGIADFLNTIPDLKTP